MDIETWQLIIAAVGTALISVVTTLLIKKGWETKVLAAWEEMKELYQTWKPIIKGYDEKLACDVEVMFTTLEHSFADSTITIAEFNDIRKAFMPLWHRVLNIIKNVDLSKK